MLIERHFSESRGGPSFVARPVSIAPACIERLEQSYLEFGESENPSYLDSLETDPAFFTTPLPQFHCRALTRVFRSPLGGDQFSTFEFVSALIRDDDWDQQLMGDIASLLRMPQVWARTEVSSGAYTIEVKTVPMSPRIGAATASRIMVLIAAAERLIAENRGVSLASGEISTAEICLVELLIPPAGRQSLVCSDRAPMARKSGTLHRLADLATEPTATFSRLERAKPTEFVRQLQERGLDRGQLPLQFVAAYKGPFAESSKHPTVFGIDGGAILPSVAPSPVSSRNQNKASKTAVVSHSRTAEAASDTSTRPAGTAAGRVAGRSESRLWRRTPVVFDRTQVASGRREPRIDTNMNRNLVIASACLLCGVIGFILGRQPIRAVPVFVQMPAMALPMDNDRPSPASSSSVSKTIGSAANISGTGEFRAATRQGWPPSASPAAGAYTVATQPSPH